MNLHDRMALNLRDQKKERDRVRKVICDALRSDAKWRGIHGMATHTLSRLLVPFALPLASPMFEDLELAPAFETPALDWFKAKIVDSLAEGAAKSVANRSSCSYMYILLLILHGNI